MEKNEVFQSFVNRAMQRLEEKKILRSCRLHVPSMDMDIQVRGLSKAEIMEVMDVDTNSDIYAGDRYAVYKALTEPDLKEVARKLKEDGKIVDPLDVTDIFEIHEMQDIARKVMELSGVSGKNRITEVVKELKNS